MYAWSSLVGSLISGGFSACASGDDDGSPTMTAPCYLCHKNIKGVDWIDGSHRKKCAVKNAEKLAQMQEPLPATCPNCSKRLKLWPDQGVEVGAAS